MSESKKLYTVALLGRKKGMSFAEFDEYWEKNHAPLAAAIPGVNRYIQKHLVLEEGTTEPDNGFGIDGLVFFEYESREAHDEGWASPAGQAALADVPNFLGEHYVITTHDVTVADKYLNQPA